MSYPDIPTIKQLKNIINSAIIRKQDEENETIERRYKIFKDDVIKTLYELPCIVNRTMKLSHTTTSHSSESYCKELQKYIERFNRESMTDIILKYEGDDKKCAINFIFK